LRSADNHYREGIFKGALLVAGSSLSPCDGSLLIFDIGREFIVKRYRTHPKPHQENLANGRKEAIPSDNYGEASALFGVIAYIINDARSGEFDDCPLM
jgi:DNA polymerase V